MSIESALRELGKEIQKDERFVALQVAAKANDADESLQQQMQEMQLISLKYQQEAEKGEEASQDRIKEFQDDYQKLYTEIMAKICKTILPLHLKWKRWHSISAV